MNPRRRGNPLKEKAMSFLRAFSDGLGKALEVLVVLLLIVMTVLMFSQVLGRYIFKNGLFWAEELSRFSMVFLVYLGAALASKYHDHISVTLLDELLAKSKNKLALKIYRTVIALITLSFLFIVTIIGMKVLPMVNAQTSPNMEIPMSVAYASIPIGTILMMLYIVLEIIRLYAPADVRKA